MDCEYECKWFWDQLEKEAWIEKMKSKSTCKIKNNVRKESENKEKAI